MTIERLRQMAAERMDAALEELRATGSVTQMFYLAKGDALTIVAVGSDVTNSEAAKQELSKMLKKRVAAERVDAVIHISDVFYTENMTPKADAIRRAFRMNIEQAAAAGLCEKHEAVMCMAHSPLLNVFMRQNYRRDGARVELDGPIQIESDEAAAEQGGMRVLPGRFNFFGTPAANA